VRRRVAERDGRRCTYVDACGQRCRETRLLEFHHLDAHARGGLPTEENLTLRCRAHNTLAAKPTSVVSTFARNAAFPTRASAANPTRKPVLGAVEPSGSAPARRIDNGGE
jgi:hypothetical protein